MGTPVISQRRMSRATTKVWSSTHRKWTFRWAHSDLISKEKLAARCRYSPMTHYPAAALYIRVNEDKYDQLISWRIIRTHNTSFAHQPQQTEKVGLLIHYHRHRHTMYHRDSHDFLDFQGFHFSTGSWVFKGTVMQLDLDFFLLY